VRRANEAARRRVDPDAGRSRLGPAWRAVIVVLSIAAASPAVAARDFRPVDQAASQPDFLAFRTLLLDALARRDARAVLSAVHVDIRNSFGGDDGTEAFEEIWKLADPDSPFWATMTAVLRLGGSFDPDHAFEAPYVFSAWPDDVDPYASVAITGSGVRVRREPRAGAEPVAVLSHEIVDAPSDGPRHDGWVFVRAHGGQSGYVDRQFARGPTDHRATFEKIEGRWQMTSFISGD